MGENEPDRDKPEPAGAVPSLAADELQIVEASYRLAAEPEAFDQLFTAWHARIEAFQTQQVAELETAQLARSSALVTDLFHRLPADTAEEGIELYIRDQAAPALVMTLSNTVVAANAAAADRFGVAVGRATSHDWLDFSACAELDALRRSARLNGNRAHAIVRLADPLDTCGELAEAQIIRPSAETGPLIFIRVLANPWNVRVARMLREAFGLTDAEVAIARALFHQPDPAVVARARGTSLRTVRNQLQQIFDKTMAPGQVELVRLIALLCANTADQASPQARWADPLGRERLFRDRAGRTLAYSWMGREGGTPAILVHGPLSGYVLAPEIEAAVAAANIQIFTICRPGFGNSDPGDGPAVDDGAGAILALAAHLDLHDCLGIGLINGLVPLAEAAARGPGRFNQLLGIGATYPLTDAHLVGLPPVQRTILTLAKQQAKALDVIVAAGVRLARRFGWEFVLARMAAGVPADRRVMFDPANIARVMASTSMVMAQNGMAFTRDCLMMFHDFRPALSSRWPLHIVAGAQDPVYPPAGVAEMAAAGLCSFELVDGAAQGVYNAAPEQVARAICAAAARSRAAAAAQSG